MQLQAKRLLAFAASAALVGAAFVGVGGVAQAASPVHRCTGTPHAPGHLAGTFWTDVVIDGVCFVDSGPAVVHGKLTILPDSALIAVFAHNRHTGAGHSSLTVPGSL